MNFLNTNSAFHHIKLTNSNTHFREISNFRYLATNILNKLCKELEKNLFATLTSMLKGALF